MTREEAINNLNMISVAFVEPVTKEQRELIDDTFEMAIYALEQQPKAIYELVPEPKTGHWIIDGHHRRCPKCDEYFCIKDAEGNEIPSSFCPNCGAKMVESEEV